MQFNLYIGNHGKRDGIEDFIEIISNVLSRRGHEVAVTNELKSDCPNIIIDEFTNIVANRKIAELKVNHPKAKFVYVLTEFIESKCGVNSFNLYGNVFDAAKVSVINLILRRKRKDLSPASFYDYLIALLLLPILFLSIAYTFVYCILKRGGVSAIKKRTYTMVYLHLRYLGLLHMIKYADLVIFAHESSKDGIESIIENNTTVIGDTIYPELEKKVILDRLFENKALGFEITGSVTKYRQKRMSLIDASILLNGLKYHIGLCKKKSFSDKKNDSEPGSAYSLHPPQSKSWKYSSPTRIYRALSHDYSLPVLTKYFGQHPIEDVCFVYTGDQSIFQLYDFYHNKQLAVDFLTPRLDKYLQESIAANNKVVQQLTSLN